MTNQLDPLPCPFCGGRAIHDYPEQAHGGMVHCISCGAEAFGPKWNRRDAVAHDAKVRADERERCVVLCTNMAKQHTLSGTSAGFVALSQAAAAIRSMEDYQ